MDDITFGLVEKPVYVRRDARGTFEEVVNSGRWEGLISGRMAKGAVMGNHYHHHTIVFFYLLDGRSRIITVDVHTKARREYDIQAGQGFVFRPSEARAIIHLEDVRFVMLKSHRFDPTVPDLIDYQVS